MQFRPRPRAVQAVVDSTPPDLWTRDARGTGRSVTQLAAESQTRQTGLRPTTTWAARKWEPGRAPQLQDDSRVPAESQVYYDSELKKNALERPGGWLEFRCRAGWTHRSGQSRLQKQKDKTEELEARANSRL